MANGIVLGGSLRLRNQASTSGGVITSIPNGSVLTVNTISGNNDWYSTSWNNHTGYVMKSFVAVSGDTVKVNASSVNVRNNPSTSGTTVLYRLSSPTTAAVTSVVTGWVKIKPSDKEEGWISADYVNKYASGTTGGSTGGGGTTGGGSTTGGTGVNTASWNQVLAGSGVYRKESSGSAVCEGVKILQRYLRAIGYGENNVGILNVDGNFGNNTEKAVKCFQKECGLTSDGIVGRNTATRLENVQNEPIFTDSNYFPLKLSLFTYSNYPYNEKSLVARIICAEHGYDRNNSQDTDARAGVAKVLLNRKNRGGVTLYASGAGRTFKNIIFGPNQYTTARSEMSSYAPRGKNSFAEAVDFANQICSNNVPNYAPLVTNQRYQKGSSVDNAEYQSKPSYCRYPTDVSSYTFFYDV